MAVSSSPWPKRPPTCEYSPSVFSRTTQKSGLPSRSGERTPGRRRTDRRLTYWSNSRRIGMSSPPERDVIGNPWEADGAKEDGVMWPQLFDAVSWHHAAGLREG